MMRRRSAGALPVVALWAGSCIATVNQDYDARPAVDGQAEDDRVVVERSGVRAAAGPPAEFPYALQRSGRSFERGRYQLFTRIRIENRRADAVDVLWPRARLEVPDGAPLGLVESVGTAAGQAGAELRAPASERLEPGETAARALIPESLHTIAVDEPLVRLCDGCEYRLVVPIRVAGREELLVLPFRLEAERQRDGGVRFLFWE